MGFRVQGLKGLRVQGFKGLRAQGFTGLRGSVPSAWPLRAQGFGILTLSRTQSGLGFRVEGLGFRVLFHVQKLVSTDKGSQLIAR